MVKRIFTLTIALLICVFSVIILSNLLNPKPKYNLVIISVDTLRADHMGVYGYKKNTTPNIDDWARNATVFTNMHTIIPATYPSFVILNTGKQPYETGVFNNGVVDGKIYSGGPPIQNNITTLAEILKRNGYKTSAFLTNPVLNKEYTNLNQGFDYYGLESIWGVNDSRKKYREFVLSTPDWIEKNKDNRFFLWVHLMDPHAPYLPSEEEACRFDEKYCEEIKSKGVYTLEEERKPIEGCATKEVSQETIGVYEALYDGAIATSDDYIGTIIDKIEHLGLDKNTVIILYGDHGEGFDHNYNFTHTNVLYESSTKIPFIISIPNRTGSIKSSLTDNSFIFSTILDILGIKKNNVGNLLSEPETNLSNNGYIYTMNVNLSKYAIQNDRYKYIYSATGKSCLYKEYTQELYDIKNDPKELVNLANEDRRTLEQLKAMLAEYSNSYFENAEAAEDKNNISPESQGKIEELKSLGY